MVGDFFHAYTGIGWVPRLQDVFRKDLRASKILLMVFDHRYSIHSGMFRAHQRRFPEGLLGKVVSTSSYFGIIRRCILGQECLLAASLHVFAGFLGGTGLAIAVKDEGLQIDFESGTRAI